MKKIIVLFGHKAVVKAAKEQGFYVINILQSNMLHSTFIKACNFADETVIINNLSELDGLIDRIVSTNIVAGIVSFTDTRDGVLKSAAYSEKLLSENRFVTKESVDILIDKKKMRDFLKSINLKLVPNIVPKTVDDVRQFLKVNGKSIIKPVAGQGSQDILLIAPEDRLEDIFPKQLNGSLSNGWLIMEKFIDGKEVSVETLTYDGVTQIFGITDKYKIPKGTPHSQFVESGHVFCANLESYLVNDIYNNVRKIFNHLNVNTTLGHTEMIIEKGTNEVYVVESHLRAGGDCIPDLVENVSGYNPYYLFFKALDGEQLPLVTNKGRSGIFYYIPEVGKISSVTKHSHTFSDDIYVKDRLDFTTIDVNPIQNSFDRKWGYIMLSGNNIEEAARKFFSKICIEYERE